MLVVVGIDVRYSEKKNEKEEKEKVYFLFCLTHVRAPFILLCWLELKLSSSANKFSVVLFFSLLTCIVNLDVYLMPSLDRYKLDLIQFIQMGCVGSHPTTTTLCCCCIYQTSSQLRFIRPIQTHDLQQIVWLVITQEIFACLSTSLAQAPTIGWFEPIYIKMTRV